MPITDWVNILNDEDKKVSNSDRKHRSHFKSLESMTERLIYKHSISAFLQEEFENITLGSDITDGLQNEKLAQALRKLTVRQRQIIEWYYWEGYVQREIAVMLNCGQSAVSMSLKRAANRLKKILSAM